MEKKKKYYTAAEALAKAQRYCAYQDRCHQEVRSKLLEWGVYGDTLEEVMADLIGDRFLDEERYARSFARGKFRIKQWGRTRIVQELKARQISDYCRRKALEEIDDAEYERTLRELLEKRAALESETDPYKRRRKLADYAIRRGFEMELVFKTCTELFG